MSWWGFLLGVVSLGASKVASFSHRTVLGSVDGLVPGIFAGLVLGIFAAVEGDQGYVVGREGLKECTLGGVRGYFVALLGLPSVSMCFLWIGRFGGFGHTISLGVAVVWVDGAALWEVGVQESWVDPCVWQ